MLGSTVTHYRIVSKLGEGGMGVVYEAEDLTLGRRVALKFCSNGRDANLLKEARAASSLNHPNIAHIYEYVEAPGSDPFIAMELVSGENLRTILGARRLTLEETLNVATSVASALAEAHRRGLIHRDIKPGNIQITESGEVKVLDFGIARAAAMRAEAEHTDATMTIEAVAGTPLYMSPEQASGEPLDGRSDLFSLGVVLYECLAGKSPFAGDTITSVVARLLTVEPPKPSRLNPRSPEHLDRVVLRLLSKDRKDRYASADELLSDLRTPGRHRSRRVMIGVALAGGVVCVGGGAAAWIWNAKRYRDPAPAAVRWYRDGLTALHNGSYHRASKDLAQAVALDPSYAMGHAYLAEAWYELDYLERAKDELLKAMTSRNSLPAEQALHLDAIHRTVTGQFKDAVVKYQEMSKLVSAEDRGGALLDLGRALERNQDTKAAMATYSDAIKLDAQNATAWLRLGALQGRTGAGDDSARSLDRAEALFQAASNVEGVTECLYVRARYARTPAQARPYLDKALEAARVTDNDQQQIKLLLVSSSAYLDAGRTEDALNDANHAIEIARAGGIENLVTRGLIDLGNALFINGRTAEALRTLQEALDIARRNRERRSEARALVNLGSVRIQTGDAKQGWQDVQAALAYYREGGYRTEAALALILLGRASRDKGDYQGAQRAFEETSDTLKPDGPSVPLALAQEGLASLARLQDRWPDALIRYEEALRTFQAIGNSSGVATDQGNVALMHALLGHAVEASTPSSGDVIVTLQVALAQEKFRDARARAEALLKSADASNLETRRAANLVLALAFARSGEGAPALDAARKAFEQAHASNKPAAEADALLALSEAAFAAGDRGAAKDYATRARAYFEAAKRPEPLWRACVMLVRCDPRDAESASKASTALGELKTSWPSGDFGSYLKRPLIHRLHVDLLRADPAAPKMNGGK
jgi:tetratricopeptide (TPR) repeat protein/predicted Ser/Thr protein kinase